MIIIIYIYIIELIIVLASLDTTGSNYWDVFAI